jgi:putative ABC transport system permease protein
METLLKDIRYAVRALIKSPGFTAVAIISLALGIGANTSIFSLINAALLRPLPYKEPDRLVMVMRESQPPGKTVETSTLWSYPKFEALRDNNGAFEMAAAVSEQNFPLTDTDEPERLPVEMVSASYFPMLGVEAARGRTFSPDEDRTPGTHPVALISHGLWQRRFGSNPEVVGQTISLNKVPMTILGVMPEWFRGQKGTTEAWVPMMMAPQLTFPRRLQQQQAHWFDVIARLKPGLTTAQAQSDLELTQEKIKEAVPVPAQMAARMGAESIKPVPLREAKTDPAISKSFLILFAAVGFVLLIACVNIANLLLSRNVSRRKEVAIRLALGATRGRLIRQLMTESVLLAVIGGVAGLLLAMWGIEFLAAFKPVVDSRGPSYIDMLDFSQAGIDRWVLGFNFLLSVGTGVLFGLLPALQASRADVSEALKEGTHAPVARRHSRTLKHLNTRNVLVVGEIALALVLLVGAGLMIRSFARLNAIPTGFDAENLITLRLQFPKYKPEERVSFNQQLLARVGALPGVEAATVASSTPLSNNSGKTIMKIKGGADDDMHAVGIHSVGPDYFKTLGIPLMRGRAFTSQDRAGSKLVAIINETAARRFFPGEDPLGKEIWLGVGWEEKAFGEVVGVSGDVKYGRVEEVFEPEVYVSYLQPTEDAAFVIARTASDPTLIVPALRREVLALGRDVPVYDVRTMEDRAGDVTSRTRFSALLLAVFAGFALTLAAVGVYGVMAYTVSGRTHEIGIRMALGARPRDILRMAMGEGVALALAGTALGIAAAYLATRVLASQLYDVQATDPLTFALVPLTMIVVALGACFVPARRATRVDPMVALRYE